MTDDKTQKQIDKAVASVDKNHAARAKNEAKRVKALIADRIAGAKSIEDKGQKKAVVDALKDLQAAIAAPLPA